MPCYHPMDAWRDDHGNVVFHQGERGGGSFPLQLPCGQCIGCRLERSRQWAVRCVHEAKMHEENCFITLTYNEENRPVGDNLVYSDFQLFMKRLRKFAGKPVRFYMCGEYGPENGRPHFHACVFGFNFADRVPLRMLGVSKLWRSPSLERLWTFGYSSIGVVNFESAAYVARYCVSKVTGTLADTHYRRVDDDGVVFNLVPEFNHMSLKPGIGATWLAKFSSDVINGDHVIINGKEASPPRYYDKLLKKGGGSKVVINLLNRELEAYDNQFDNTPDRLFVKERVSDARLNIFKRGDL